METLINVAVEILRLVPLILLFYVPALLGVATWKERGEGYAVKAGLWFALGIGGVVLIQLMLRSVSALQVLATLGVSLVQIAVALILAALTVYKLAD
ncbi:MAG TPA: hypothetical protein VFE21_10935 [Rubrobacteraceae bacterium]|nr:hypothetical protein [Rubrobacteraceae bacterium]